MGKIKVGDRVEIKFLDHVEDGNTPYEFFVWGRIQTITDLAYTVQSWAYVDPSEDSSEDDDNIKKFTILKGAVLDIRKVYTRRS